MARLSVLASLLLSLVIPSNATSAPLAKEVEVNGVRLPYVEQGSGEPVVRAHCRSFFQMSIMVGREKLRTLMTIELYSSANAFCGLRSDISRGPRSANGRHMHRSADRRYSITSSARASSVAGRSKPIALAVLRLITSSYLVGACTGSSAGFSPLRMRST
jgi:hypothetical protein